MYFEWDSKKAESNLKKHGVSFYEAISVFGDPLAITFSDPDHSILESRYLTFGMSKIERLLLVVHIEQSESRVRIISARKATKKERANYENE